MGEKRRTALTTVALVVSGLVLATVSTGTHTFSINRVFRVMVGGVQEAVSTTGFTVVESVRSVAALRQLRADHEALLAELDRYRNLEGDLAVLESENQRLRELLDFPARTEQPVLPARVIARETGGLFSSYTINRGSRNGVRRDQTVVAYMDGRQSFVGRIETVAGGTAVVVPAFAATSYVAVRLENMRHEGLIRGGGERWEPLVMSYVPRSARDQIRYRDLVVTSGLNSIFPEGILIGHVERVTAPSFEPALTIFVEPAVDFSRLEYVFVLTASGGAAQ